VARIDVIDCDNCSRRLDPGEQVTSVMRMDWCERCASFTALPLHRIPLMQWPKLVTRTDVRAYLEWRDEQDAGAAKKLAVARQDLQRSIREVERLREQAADGYANGDMAKALADIASNAKRAQEVAGDRDARAHAPASAPTDAVPAHRPDPATSKERDPRGGSEVRVGST